MRIITVILFGILSFVSVQSIDAQTPFFQQFLLAKKREPVSINAMHQDKSGLLWLGTNRGLFRFDGKGHMQYTISDSLPDNDVTTIAEDSAGRIWTGHRNGSLSYLENGKFVKFNPEEGTSPEPVSDILFDKNGVLWFSTLNDGLYYFVNERLYRLDEENGMPDLYVYDIFQDVNGKIYAATDGGIAICSREKTKVTVRSLSYKDGLPDNIIRKFSYESDSIVWMATEDAGIFSFNVNTGQIRKPFQSWPYGSVSDIVVSKNHIWVACPEKGLALIDRDDFETKFFSKDVTGTSSANVLLKDVEGNLWCGSKSGLLRTPGEKLQFINQFGAAKDQNTLAVTVDYQKRIWFSTPEGLFTRTLNSDGLIAYEQPLAKTPYKSFTVISLFTDSFGYIWAGLYGEGILRINPETKSIQHIATELRNGNVLSINGSGRTIWLATLGGAVKASVEGEKISFTSYGIKDGLSSDFIYKVFTDSKNRVWFATDGKGVDMLDQKGFHHYEQGLPSKIIYSICEDGDNRIWTNVQGNGLYYFDEKGAFTAAPSSWQIHENDLGGICSDNLGRLMLMYESGITIVEPRSGNIHSFGEESGMRDYSLNLNAIGSDQNGNIYLGTNNGIVIYEPDEHLLEHKPIAKIDHIKIFDKLIVDLSKFASLPFDQNNITFNYLGLWYQNPENLYFSYKLDNYDREWLSSKNTNVTYSKLPPGSYTFRLRVSATGNFDSASEASLSFTIHPPFWQTPAFYMVTLVAIVVGAFSFSRYRERKLLHDKMVLETKVKRRTMEVQRQNEEIQAQNEEIMAQAEEIKGINENLEMIVQERTLELERKNKALEEYAFINAHKLRSPVASILGLVHLMTRTTLNDENREITNRLRQSAEELDAIVRSITKAIENGDVERAVEENDKKH
jgi:ligand-binding sensor domain-containing protein